MSCLLAMAVIVLSSLALRSSRLSSGDREMRLDRLSCLAVDRQDILRASRERDYELHFGPQPDIAAGQGPRRRLETERTVGAPGNVHEQVERARHLRRDQTQ